MASDAYILKSVIYDWDDDHSVAILRNCRRAMVEKGKVLLVEMLMPLKGGAAFGKPDRSEHARHINRT